MLKRPTTIAEMRESQKGFATEEGIALGLAYRPQPTEVFITPYPKCGTTWVQQIVHGLLTRGSMDFDEITAVVPWIELAHDMGIEVAPQSPPACPRAFKSHLDWEQIPKGGCYINVYRDPRDALLSMYRFMEGWIFETGAISITGYALEFFLQRESEQSYWSHAASWWRQRDRDDVLLLCFEHMKLDLSATVRRIAEFVGVELDDELHELVVEQSSIEFMKRHARQFDDHLIRETRDEPCGLPPGGDSSKVRDGKVGGAKLVLSGDIVEQLEQRWHEQLTSVFGLANYEDLQRRLASRESAL